MLISEMAHRNDGGSGSGSGIAQDAALFGFLANAGLLLATQEAEGRKRKKKKKKPPPPPQQQHKDSSVEMMAEAGYVYLGEDAEEAGSRLVIIGGEDRASTASFCCDVVGAGRGMYPCVSGKDEKKVTGLFREGGAMAAATATLGLELGKRTYFEEASSVPNGSSVLSSAQAPMPIQMKRPRVPGQSPKCQVEGCKADLSGVKDYHRRHKVCDFHSKAAKVVMGGREQRFCQQCSRFHGLTEFDEDKRSCRQRLAGHNERRRKPQPDALAGLSASLLPAFQDSRKLGHFYMDRVSFLALPGISSVLSTAHCDEYEVAPIPLKGASWPASLEMSKLRNPVFVTDLHHPSAKLPHFNSFPQSPKTAIPAAKDAKAPQYFQQHHLLLQGHGVKPPTVVESLSLTSSGSRGVPSADGLEAIPLDQGYLSRVSDSGRALSLQSNMQQRSSSSAVSMDSKAHPSMVSEDQGLDTTADDPPVPLSAETLGQTGEQQQQQQQQQQQHYHHQHRCEWMNEKLFSASSAGYGAEDSNMIEKDHHHLLLERSLAGSTRGGNYESSLPPSCSFLSDVKPTTIDLLQISSATSHSSQSTLQSLVPSGAYEIGIGPFGDLQAIRPFDSPSIFSFQQT